MDELVLFIAKSLVDKPDAVKVEMHEDDDAFVIELSVDPSDVGKVIGKQGRIAKAIRTIVKAASVDAPKKYVVDILCRNTCASGSSPGLTASRGPSSWTP